MNSHPVSPNQERFILAELHSENSFHIPVYYEISGRLDADRLKASVLAACGRHDACQTTFAPAPDGHFLAQRHENPEIEFHHMHADSRSDEAILAAVLAHLAKPNLSSLGDLHKCILIERSPEEHGLVLSQHHSVSDGQSMEIFADEVFKLYDGQELPPAVSFYDVIRDQTSDPAERKKSEDFWTRAFQNSEGVPDLVGDIRWSDVAGQSNFTRPNFIRHGLKDGVLDRLTDLAKHQNISLFAVLGAIFSLQISAQTARRTVGFSFQSSGRFGLDPELPVIGSFSNALLLAIDVEPAERFLDLAHKVSDQTKAALLHEDIPYHHIQKFSGTSPKFALNLYPDEIRLNAAGLDISHRTFLNCESDYALNLRWSVEDGELNATAFFDCARISANRIASFNQKTERLIATVVASPDKLNEAILLETTSNRIRPAVATGTGMANTGARIHSRFFECAAKNPKLDAIVLESEIWSYGELRDRIVSLGGFLRASGVESGDRVAIIMNRDPLLIVSMFAVSRLGASFAILDPAYSADRLQEYCATLELDYLLTADDENELSHRVILPQENRTPVIRISDFERAGPASDLPSLSQPSVDTPAYFLFTSVTTGGPKCVAVSHQPLQYFVAWQTERFALSKDDRFTVLSGLAHDIIMRDIFTPLSIGASLAIPTQNVLFSPSGLVSWLAETKPTICHLTPPLGQIIASGHGDKPRLPSIRYMFWGGDMLGRDLTARFAAANPAMVQVNFYGATETPQAVSYYVYEAGPDWVTVPVGGAIASLTVEVVNAAGQICDINEIGEIQIRSPFYVSQLKNGSLADDVYEQVGLDEYLYRTGDFGYFLPDGDIVPTGRADDQIKIRGYRVELEEINRAILNANAIQSCIIPTDVIHDTLAHFRRVMEASRSGMVRRSFQAMQQASTMAS